MQAVQRKHTDSATFTINHSKKRLKPLKSYLKGNYEVADNPGILSTEQTRNAKATEMFGKAFNDLDGIQKQGVLMAMFEDANKVSMQWAKLHENPMALKMSWGI